MLSRPIAGCQIVLQPSVKCDKLPHDQSNSEFPAGSDETFCES